MVERDADMMDLNYKNGMECFVFKNQIISSDYYKTPKKIFMASILDKAQTNLRKRQCKKRPLFLSDRIPFKKKSLNQESKFAVKPKNFIPSRRYENPTFKVKLFSFDFYSIGTYLSSLKTLLYYILFKIETIRLKRNSNTFSKDNFHPHEVIINELKELEAISSSKLIMLFFNINIISHQEFGEIQLEEIQLLAKYNTSINNN
ncbi:hypothetical protein H8356DRAFT_1341330 [Neocallimastix lanati (nom. inval.)]|nr:hypothetical protein H8356DRAFT_1341330 [Neocallimastix sp. JGI-2020a]